MSSSAGKKTSIPKTIATKMSFSDTPSLDAFSRQRVSDPVTIFDSQSQYGDNDLFWETKLNGAGIVTNSLYESSVILSTGGTTSGDYAYRQTRTHFRYQPGKSQLVFLTFNMNDIVENARTRIGYFDETNGIFLQRSDSTLSIVKRSSTSGSPVDDVIPQSSWNIDKLNGSGPSRILLDVSKSQILVIDLQWLGVGRVRIGFDIEGIVYYVHQFFHANILDSVYMTTANLPVRTEVENTGVASGTLTIKQICASVISEGGFEEQRGLQFSTTRGTGSLAVTTRRPVLSLRAKTTGPNSVRNTGQILLKNVELSATTNGCLYEIVLNGTLTSGSFSSYNSDYSLADVDTSATAISGGLVIDSGVVPAAAAGAFSTPGSGKADLFRKLPIVYTGLNDYQDVLTVVVSSLNATSNIHTCLTWQEFY